MANTIKLKQGSGSDPSASDLALGEPAIRTDTGEIFLKKDDGSIAKVAGGIDDGDKGDIVVSNSGATFTIDNGVVSTGKIADNAVTMAKLQDLDQNTIFGRIASGSGNPTALTAANVRTMINVENGATADQSASEILTLLKTVDGAGSGLDADTLDGISSGSFVRSDADDTLNGRYTISDSVNEKLVLAGSTSPYIRFQENTTNKAYIQWNSDGYINLVNSESGEAVRIQSGASGLKFVEGGNVRNVYHTGNLSVGDGGLSQNNFTNTLKSKLDGIASGATNVTNNNQLTNGAGFITSADGGNAATLDSLDSTAFLRSDTADTASGDITFSGGAGAATIAANSDISFTSGSTWSGNHTKITHHSNILYIVGGTGGIIFREGGTNRWRINGDGHFDPQSDSTYDIGETSSRVRVGYFDELDSAEVRVNNGIVEVKNAIATSHSLTADYNGFSVSPTINSGVTVTVPSGAVFAIV